MGEGAAGSCLRRGPSLLRHRRLQRNNHHSANVDRATVLLALLERAALSL